MYANLVTATVHDYDRSIEELNEMIPNIKQMPGFVKGLWLGDREAGRAFGIVVWESREAARTVAENPPPLPPDSAITRDSIQTLEVLGEA